MELTAKNVDKMFRDTMCDTPEGSTLVEGIRAKFYLSNDKLDEYQDDIVAMLNELPEEFHQDSGGGWSFLNACNRRDGSQWADLHMTMEQLICLGIGINKVSYLMPREMWEMLPGAMPYFVVKK